VILWRFTRHLALDGRGGLLASARWHSRGRAILYCAPNPATALLEVLVHSAVRDVQAFGGFHFVKLDLPDDVGIESVQEGQLPPDWSRRIDLTRDWGDRWLREERSAALFVRSVLVPETYNSLVNPRHAEASRLQQIAVFPYPLDARLFGAVDGGGA
jgi:RES domain-containing protein